MFDIKGSVQESNTFGSFKYFSGVFGTEPSGDDENRHNGYSLYGDGGYTIAFESLQLDQVYQTSILSNRVDLSSELKQYAMKY